MATTRLQRNERIAHLEEAFTRSAGIYLTDINRIDVEKMTKLRRDFREKGITYLVVKNTLAKIAMGRCNSGKDELVSHFTGPIGVALADSDSTVPAKVIKDFQKENKNLLPVKVAFVDGSIFSDEDTKKLADLPSREELLAQFLSCLQAPMRDFAGALNGILTKFVGTVEEVRKKKESEG